MVDPELPNARHSSKAVTDFDRSTTNSGMQICGGQHVPSWIGTATMPEPRVMISETTFSMPKGKAWPCIQRETWSQFVSPSRDSFGSLVLSRSPSGPELTTTVWPLPSGVAYSEALGRPQMQLPFGPSCLYQDMGSRDGGGNVIEVISEQLEAVIEKLQLESGRPDSLFATSLGCMRQVIAKSTFQGLQGLQGKLDFWVPHGKARPLEP